MKSIRRILGTAAVLTALATPGLAADSGSPAEGILASLRASAATEDIDFDGFKGDRGKDFYHAIHEGGRAPSCTTCHGEDPTREGALPNGQSIAPLAVSANPRRMSDPGRYFKQIQGCCMITLGHDCSAKQKGDVSTYLLKE